MQPRDKAYRRSQRDRVLEARRGRLPLPEVNLPRRLWRLYSPGGVALPVFYREDSHQFNVQYRHERFQKEPHLTSLLLGETELWQLPGPVKVRLRHFGECRLAGPQKRYVLVRPEDGRKFFYQEEIHVPTGPCTCKYLVPSWPGG